MTTPAPDQSAPSLAERQAALKRRSIGAVKWSALGELLFRSVQPLMLLALAQLLTPEDFGLVGVATIAIGLAQIFLDFGLGKALIQTERNVDTYANNAFWINVTLAGFMYAGLAGFARPLSVFFKCPHGVEVLRVLGLQIILTSLVSVHLARLQREVRFKAFFWVRFLPALTTGGLAVGLALAGRGVWALVWGTLAGGVLQAGLCWAFGRWQPRLAFEWMEFRRMLAFSQWVLLESMLAWLIIWGDAIALGHFLGPEALGYYRMGSVAIAFVSNIVFTPVVPVALGWLSRLQNEPAAFAEAFGKLTRLIVLLSLPLGAGAIVTGALATEVLLGPTWLPAGVVVQLMGLRMGLEWLVGLNSTAFTAIGRPEVNVQTLLIAAAVSLPVYLWAAPHGLVIFCWARLLSAQLNNLIGYQFARRVLRLPAGFLWNRVRWPLAACVCMGATVWLLEQLPAPSWLRLATQVPAGAAVYAGTLYLVDRSGFVWCWRALRQVFERRAGEPALT